MTDIIERLKAAAMAAGDAHRRNRNVLVKFYVSRSGLAVHATAKTGQNHAVLVLWDEVVEDGEAIQKAIQKAIDGADALADLVELEDRP